tara:strand:- start:3349 stop:5310 length:1962 start_codon:yes stop_codon:yes gene_type:complete
MSFNLEQLTEGIRQRHVGAQNKRLTEKWNRTGLLRGLDDIGRETMSTLLENQAAQVLREANTLGGTGSASSDIRGFANIAFPIVRRVFGGLVANELVSIQPMSLPSGLLFYLDYTYGTNVGGDEASAAGTATESVYSAGQSIYNSPVGKGVQSGSLGTGGQYDLLGSGYSRARAVTQKPQLGTNRLTSHKKFFSFNASTGVVELGADSTPAPTLDATSAKDLKMLQFDSEIIDKVSDGTLTLTALALPFTTTNFSGIDSTTIKDIGVMGGGYSGLAVLDDDSIQGGKGLVNIRRLNQLVTWDGTNAPVAAPLAKLGDANAHVLFIVKASGNLDNGMIDDTNGKVNAVDDLGLSFIKADSFNADASGGDTLTVPSFESSFDVSDGDGGTAAPVIPEIDIKIESIPVTAQTRKLRARWSPELAQDLNAYHSMDAEVELTQILSEQIALEIDREILNDLLTQAQGANYYWSRSPGKFVNKKTGTEIARTSTLTPGPAFTGTVREWYETLTETVIDVANEIHRKTLRGSANFIVVSPDVATILEASVLYRPAYSLDGDGQVGAPFTMGAEKIGTLSNRFTVYKDPYFPRNKILVGYKGGSYLETGFVYAPYVPLIVTPTIFAPEDFTPRKGVMTRYGKKMVRADFYGTVTCLDMNVI